MKIIYINRTYSQLRQPDGSTQWSAVLVVATGPWKQGTRIRTRRFSSSDGLLSYVNKLHMHGWINDSEYEAMYSSALFESLHSDSDRAEFTRFVLSHDTNLRKDVLLRNSPIGPINRIEWELMGYFSPSVAGVISDDPSTSMLP
jgi:hypothetical protein